MTLLGPADAAQFRVQVGRYGDRWYCDPLDADSLASATSASWPSVSIVKKADPFTAGHVTACQRIAAALIDNPGKLVGMQYDEIYSTLMGIDKLGLQRAAQRGTNVHTVADARLNGRVPLLMTGEPGSEYTEALDQFFTDYRPTLIASEFVVINRSLHGVGYGGTVDALVEIDGRSYLVDWKSRGHESAHATYGGELAQLGAYSGAEYMIVQGRNGVERCRMPALDGGLIISVRPDGCAAYQVDLTRAQSHFVAMHAWWISKKDEKGSAGQRLRPPKVQPFQQGATTSNPVTMTIQAVQLSADWEITPARRELLDRAATMTIKERHDRALDVLERAEAASEPPPFDVPTPIVPPTPQAQVAALRDEPEEGQPCAVDAADALRRSYEALVPVSRAWVNTLAEQAAQARCSFHMSRLRSVRRFELMRALVKLAERGSTDDETLRALLAVQLGEVARLPHLKLGQIIGSLDYVGAALFAQHVDEFIYGNVDATVDETGMVALHFAA